MKSNGRVPLLNAIHKLYKNATICINDWITSFSQFDINAKKLNLMQKTSGNVFLGYLGVSFSYFPKVASDHGRSPHISFRSFMDHVTIFSASSMYHLQWISLRQKIGNSWKLPLTIVTENFLLNMAGLLDPTLKDIDKLRLNWTLTFQKRFFYFLQSNPFKSDKNPFYFILNPLFCSQDVYFFSVVFGHVERTT